MIGRGSTLHEEVFELLYETGRAEEDPVHGRSLRARHRHRRRRGPRSRAGFPTGLVMIPVRYMHSPVETVDLNDVQATIRLLAATALALKPDRAFVR